MGCVHSNTGYDSSRDKSSFPGSLGDLEVQPPGFVLIQAYVKSITRSNQFSDLQFSNT